MYLSPFFLNNCTCKEVISYIQPWSAISCSDLVLGHGDWRAGPLSFFRSQLKAGEMCFSSDVLSAPSVQSVTYVTKWRMHAMVPVGLSPQERCLWAFLYHLFFSQGTSVMKWLKSHQLTANFGGTCWMWLYSLRGSDVPYQKKNPKLGGSCCLWEKTWAEWSEMNSTPISPALSPRDQLWRSE